MSLRAYQRFDPRLFERKVLEQGYPAGAFAALVGAIGAAEAQPERGRFRSERVLRALLESYGRWVPYLIAHRDVIVLDDGRLYVDGWDEWQEGDWKVQERVTRIRNRRRTVATVAPVTVESVTPVTVESVSTPSERKQEHSNTPIPPPSGGSPRANGTNPRAIAAEITRRANAAEAERKARRKARHVAYLDGRLTEAQRVEMDDRDAPLDEIPAVRGAAYQPMPPAAEPPADAGTESWFEPGGGAS
jgi:hypothetical protein